VKRLFKTDFIFYLSLTTTPGVFDANEALLIQTKERKRNCFMIASYSDDVPTKPRLLPMTTARAF